MIGEYFDLFIIVWLYIYQGKHFKYISQQSTASMNNQNIHSRTQHPHLFLQKDSDKKPSRSKIELTHIHHTPRSGDSSNYTINTAPSYVLKSQHEPPSNSKDRSLHLQEQSVRPPINNHLYLLMKQQIDIAADNYREKMSRALKIQAQQIHKLSSVIAYNNQIIQKQQEIIKGLGRNQEFLSSTRRSRASGREDNRNSSKSPGKISLTQRKSVQKMINRRDVSPGKGQNQHPQAINAKIDTLAGVLDDIEKRIFDYAIKNRELFNKIKDLQKKVNNQIWKRMKNCEELIEKYIKEHEDKVMALAKQTDFKGIETKELKIRIQDLTEEMKELKELMYNLANREFTYDSYQLNALKSDLTRIASKVNEIIKEPSQQQQRSQTDKKSYFPQNQNHLPPQLFHSYSLKTDRQRVQRANDQFQYQYSQLQKSYLSSLSHHEPRHYSSIEEKVKQSQDWEEIDRKSPSMSDDDEFYFQESDAQKKQRQYKLTKLCSILQQGGYKFPVRVEIDETGYLKECMTGIYILDEHDNGFELNKEDVSILKQNGIILI